MSITNAPATEAPPSHTTFANNGACPRSKKLHGREFYESIGSPKFILAPMVDQSEFVCSPIPPPINIAYNPSGLANAFSLLYDPRLKQISTGIYTYVACADV